MIIALEGALATGKSTVASHLAERHGAFPIEEVNKHFKRSAPEPDDWYLIRQLERLEIANREEEHGSLVVMAGDPFQPIWFNWCYPELGFLSWQHALEFFMARATGFRLPSFYGFLTASEEELYERQMARENARGLTPAQAQAKHDRYLKMVKPQRMLFNAIGTEFPRFVCQGPPAEVSDTAESLLAFDAVTPEASELLNFIRVWLALHSPDDFD